MGGGVEIRGAIRFALVVALVATGLSSTRATAAVPPLSAHDGTVYVSVGGGRATLGNDLVERRWDLMSFRTVTVVDKRGTDRVWGRSHRDFSLGLVALDVGSEAFSVTNARVAQLARGGLRLELTLRSSLAPVLTVNRTIEAYPGVAGFRTETTVASSLPAVLSRATTEEIDTGTADATLHALRAGADWREPGWAGPPVSVGDPHAGTWRDTTSAFDGRPLRGPGEWLSLRSAQRSAFIVQERNDFPSTVMSYDGRVARAANDFGRDVVSLGPFEGSIHVENPLPVGATRLRTIRPGEPLRLAPVFTGFGDHDGDEPWQFHRYLTEHRLTPYPHAVTFNSNGTDADRISTGAKDDMDLATVQQVAGVARSLGVETFILDDGWQARSGDWQPDSPQFPEPRWDGTPTSKFKPRFPDATFDAVRTAIAPMRLGLWMSPTFFNPKATTFTSHPEWTCQPIATPLIAANLAQPDSSSNEAGLGAWSQSALAHVESRIRDAIERWRVAYFKFDFLAWLDCLTPSGGVRDMYEFHDAFVAMLDRLQAAHPDVTFQIDETNDYRLFPYEAIARGPTWFQNGRPPQRQMLHNLWNLSPFVPTFSIGQHALADEQFDAVGVDALMAGALLSHMTFFSDIRNLPQPVVDRVKVWTDFYKRSRSLLDGVVYPLLDDPLGGGWTALQAWDPVAGEGALLAFRQQASEASVRIALENVPDGTYELSAGPGDEPSGTVTAAQLRSGIDVTIPAKEGAAVFLIRRAG